MTQSDSFIEEVTEEVRRDRLFAWMRRYGWIAVLAVLLIVGGAAWREWSKARQQAAAEALGDAIYAAVERPDAASRVEALGEIAPKGEAAAVAALLRAAEDPDGGAEALAALAADETLPLRYSQLAALKLAMMPGQTPTPEARLQALAPLAEPGRPYRALALEQMALAEIEAGQTEAALDRLRGLLDDADASAGLRQRAAQLIVALGGTAAVE